MIKPNELRIGNLIKSDTGLLSSSEFEFLTVSYLKKDLLFFEEVQMIGEFPEDCAGIPLTEEWLLMFGFEKINHIYQGQIFLHRKTKIRFINIELGVCEFRSYILNNKIKHVHQLQNLYFALTGEELTIE